MKVEVWSDIVCPWCYIGKRRLEHAIERFDGPVTVEWRSFELDPSSPLTLDRPLIESLARKYRVPVERAQLMLDRVVSTARKEGLEFDYDAAQTGNTFDAHQLIHLARAQGLGPAMKERLLQAYFCEGAAISDRETLVELAAAMGLDGTEAAAALEAQTYAGDVRADEAAARSVGVTGVPFFLIDGKYAVSGAQEADTMLAVFEQVRALELATAPQGEACSDESCEV